MNDAKSNPWAEIKRLQAENANLHFLIEQANEAMAGLRAENEKLKANLEEMSGALLDFQGRDLQLRNQIAATEEALAQVQRESAELRSQGEAAKKVADAAVVFLYGEFEGGLEGHQRRSWALTDAVREYRAHAEPPAPDPADMGFYPGFPPGFDVKRAEKGLAQEGGSREIGQAEA